MKTGFYKLANGEIIRVVLDHYNTKVVSAEGATDNLTKELLESILKGSTFLGTFGVYQ